LIILVLGSKGQLGRCLHDQLGNSGHEVIYTSHEQIDIADFEFTKSKILEISPEVIINAAAYTAVDKAEEDQEMANLINHLAVAHLAKICKQLGCWLIHVSTDYVFDGSANIPYREDDKTNPQCVYGETKLKGELAIQSSGCKYIIIRTAWVFSEYGNNFLKTMLRLGSERDELNIVGDQVGCPTFAQDIARSMVKIISKLQSRKDNSIYHFCGYQRCSWYEFANAIFDIAKTNNLKIPNTISSIDTSAYPTSAKRPSFSVLDCSKIEEEYDVRASNWHDGIEQAIEKLKSENTTC
jgi:dTDP-4-dehydrorhamnose reductase